MQKKQTSHYTPQKYFVLIFVSKKKLQFCPIFYGFYYPALLYCAVHWERESHIKQALLHTHFIFDWTARGGEKKNPHFGSHSNVQGTQGPSVSGIHKSNLGLIQKVCVLCIVACLCWWFMYSFFFWGGGRWRRKELTLRVQVVFRWKMQRRIGGLLEKLV